MSNDGLKNKIIDKLKDSEITKENFKTIISNTNETFYATDFDEFVNKVKKEVNKKQNKLRDNVEIDKEKAVSENEEKTGDKIPKKFTIKVNDSLRQKIKTLDKNEGMQEMRNFITQTLKAQGFNDEQLNKPITFHLNFYMEGSFNVDKTLVEAISEYCYVLSKGMNPADYYKNGNHLKEDENKKLDNNILENNESLSENENNLPEENEIEDNSLTGSEEESKLNDLVIGKDHSKVTKEEKEIMDMYGIDDVQTLREMRERGELDSLENTFSFTPTDTE